MTSDYHIEGVRWAHIRSICRVGSARIPFGVVSLWWLNQAWSVFANGHNERTGTERNGTVLRPERFFGAVRLFVCWPVVFVRSPTVCSPKRKPTNRNEHERTLTVNTGHWPVVFVSFKLNRSLTVRWPFVDRSLTVRWPFVDRSSAVRQPYSTVHHRS